MSVHPILLNGSWSPSASSEWFQTKNPGDKTLLPDRFPVSGWDDLQLMLEAAHAAAAELATAAPEAIADFLDGYANEIEGRSEALIESAHRETALPKEPRLAKAELPRTVNQLRLAAAACRDQSWRRATIDTANHLRSVHSPLGGPVMVFGPNNFPFAYNGVAGGDFAAAVAAGNPVIAKAHPAHPNTSRLLAEAALAALEKSDLPRATVQLFYQTSPENGLRLVSHPLTAATGFTGSRSGGLALKKAADEAGKPIFLEMSSVNPVVILPGALQERGEAITEELHDSCALGAGQFCTKPGIAIVGADIDGLAFLSRLSARFETSKPGTLLTENSASTITQAIDQLVENGATVLRGGLRADDAVGFAFQPTLLTVTGERFLENPRNLQSEAFGTVCLVVATADLEEMKACVAALEGNLTGSIYTDSHGSDDAIYREIEPILRPKVGRLLNDKMPTGVAVSAAMNHGGPYPATGHPGFSAVGVPVSLFRFTALHSYDNVRHDRLPPILQNPNPTGSTWRFIDGQWSQASL